MKKTIVLLSLLVLTVLFISACAPKDGALAGEATGGFKAKCIGTMPSNAKMCPGDSSGFSLDVPGILVESCTPGTKCEYICKSGYQKSGNSCVSSSGPICTGLTPAYTSPCAGDDQGLTISLAKTVVTACTDAKCEYVCNSGYVKSGSSCVPLCTGSTPSNAQLCSGDNQGFTTPTARTLVPACTDTAKCEYICNSGFGKVGNFCMSTSVCSGATPPTAHAQLCPGDNQGLTAPAMNTIVTACTDAVKCEYTCEGGYAKVGNSCVVACTNSGGWADLSHTLFCPGDQNGVTFPTQDTIVPVCTDEVKCEHVCMEGYVFAIVEGKNACVPD